jgi:hypothetical protein
MSKMSYFSKSEFLEIFIHFFSINKWLCRTNESGCGQEVSMLFAKHPCFLSKGIIMNEWRLACQNLQILQFFPPMPFVMQSYYLGLNDLNNGKLPL